MLFDFSDVWKPFKVNVSSLLTGNDFRYDSNGNNPKQNFTTYVEISYSFEKIYKKIYKKINLEPTIGVVLNNQAHYYSTSNYNKPSFVNLGIKITLELELDNHFSLPIYLNYICNPSIESTEQLGKKCCFRNKNQLSIIFF